MAGSNQGGQEVSRGFLGDPSLKVNLDGTVQFDSSREPLARVRPFEQGSLGGFDPLGDKYCNIPNPVSNVVGSGDDLITAAPVGRIDADDAIGSGPGYSPNPGDGR